MTAAPEVDAALVVLAKLGVSPEGLLTGVAAERPQVPAFAEFVPQVADGVSPDTRKAYR